MFVGFLPGVFSLFIVLFGYSSIGCYAASTISYAHIVCYLFLIVTEFTFSSIRLLLYLNGASDEMLPINENTAKFAAAQMCVQPAIQVN